MITRASKHIPLIGVIVSAMFLYLIVYGQSAAKSAVPTEFPTSSIDVAISDSYCTDTDMPWLASVDGLAYGGFRLCHFSYEAPSAHPGQTCYLAGSTLGWTTQVAWLRGVKPEVRLSIASDTAFPQVGASDPDGYCADLLTEPQRATGHQLSDFSFNGPRVSVTTADNSKIFEIHNAQKLNHITFAVAQEAPTDSPPKFTFEFSYPLYSDTKTLNFTTRN